MIHFMRLILTAEKSSIFLVPTNGGIKRKEGDASAIIVIFEVYTQKMYIIRKDSQFYRKIKGILKDIKKYGLCQKCWGKTVLKIQTHKLISAFDMIRTGTTLFICFFNSSHRIEILNL